MRNINFYFNFSVSGLLNQDERTKWVQVLSDIEISTDSWLPMTLKCLTLIAQRPNCVNVLVTNNQLVAALAKILLFGLAQSFPVENIYSTNKIGMFPRFFFIIIDQENLQWDKHITKRCTKINRIAGIIKRIGNHEHHSTPTSIKYSHINGHISYC